MVMFVTLLIGRPSDAIGAPARVPTVRSGIIAFDATAGAARGTER
jgi:hypothetical protein